MNKTNKYIPFRLLAVSCMIFSGCGGKSASEARAEPGVSAKPLVGAYYYPWYYNKDSYPHRGKGYLLKSRTGSTGWPGNFLRDHLKPKQTPALGHYNSFDPSIIGKHIEQSIRGNISFWASSWWGPYTYSDQVLKNYILKHPDAAKLKYAILYESNGRIRSRSRRSGNRFENLNYRNVISDFKYIERTYFDNPNYLKINGKSVVFVYLGRAHFREQGHDVLANLRKIVPDVYIVSDDVYGETYEADWAKPFDAITAYDVYGQSTKEYGGTRKAIDALATNYANAKQKANFVGTAFIPAISPGYNDRSVRDGNPGRARYFTDDPTSKEGDIFRAMIDDVALKTIDPKANNMMIITSFNEWYEDSQIEATAGDQATSKVDDSDTGDYFTGGQRYVDYGYLYLDILSEHTK